MVVVGVNPTLDADEVKERPLAQRFDPRNWEEEKAPQTLEDKLRLFRLNPGDYTVNEEAKEIIITKEDYELYIPDSRSSDNESPRGF